MLPARLASASIVQSLGSHPSRSAWSAVARGLQALCSPSSQCQNAADSNGCRALAEVARELPMQAESLHPTKSAPIDPLQVLNKYWGYTQFRYSQEQVVRSVLRGEDNLAVMATGCGKSICFQVPTIASGKVCIVVSPLISLMEDQVSALNARRISACYMGSAQSSFEVKQAGWDGEYLFLYMTPELVVNSLPKLEALHKKRGVGLIAVDEAHCTSEWGHDFRPEYQLLGVMRQALPKVPILAVTATATERVRQDILNTLLMGASTKITIDSFERFNLTFSVQQKLKPSVAGLLDEAFVQLVQRTKAIPSGKREPTLIYAMTIAEVENIYAALEKHLPNRVGRYHAKLTPEDRREAHTKYLNDDLDIMVASVAYGMGIDKPNIRHVIHFGRPASIESYYQQAGRAGRDGQHSYCTLLWSLSDRGTLDRIKDAGALSIIGRDTFVQSMNAMEAYCSSTNCRHAVLVNHFATGLLPLQGYCRTRCDNCQHGNFNTRDFTREAQIFLSAMYWMKGKCGLGKVVHLLQGASKKHVRDWWLEWQTLTPEKEQLYGAGEQYSEKWWKALTGLLLNEKLIEYKNAINQGGGSISVVALTPLGRKQLLSSAPLLLPVPTDMVAEEEEASSGLVKESKEKEKSRKLMELLQEARKKRADRLGMAPTTLVDDSTLVSLVRRQSYAGKQALTTEDMRSVPGMSDQAITDFGVAFEAAIAAHLAPPPAVPKSKSKVKKKAPTMLIDDDDMPTAVKATKSNAKLKEAGVASTATKAPKAAPVKDNGTVVSSTSAAVSSRSQLKASAVSVSGTGAAPSASAELGSRIPLLNQPWKKVTASGATASASTASASSVPVAGTVARSI